MKKIKRLLCSAIIIFACCTTAIAQQVHSGPIVKQAAKETVKQRAWYGPEENLLASFWKNNPSLLFNAENTIDMPREMGYVFTSAKKGVITQLGARMPRETAAGPVMGYLVSLWDYDSRQLIKRCQVDLTDIRLTFKTLDEEIPVTANKKYVISIFIKPVNSTANKWMYYTMIKPGSNNTAANFMPYTEGNLTFLNTQSTTSANPAFPDNMSYHMDIATGLCDLVFKATEK